MALKIVTPVKCPFTNDVIAVSQSDLDLINDSVGRVAVLEKVCPTCGATGRFERRQDFEVTVTPNQLASGQAGQVVNNDKHAFHWVLDVNRSVVKTLTPT